jgi:hypothetical protein
MAAYSERKTIFGCGEPDPVVAFAGIKNLERLHLESPGGGKSTPEEC